MRGISLVQTAASVALLAVGVLATAGSMVSSSQSTRVTDEMETARRAIAERVELLKAAPFKQVFAMFDASTANDPVGVVSPGKYFVVTDLVPPAGVLPDRMGWVEFPTVEVGGVMQIHENLDLPQFGMPRDLTADGVVDALDHSADYKLLPVSVHLVWKGVEGNSSLHTTLLLANR